MRGPYTTGRSETEQEESGANERGDTLIEVLLALVVLGLAGIALLTAFATAITASSEHRHLATLDASVRAATDQVISQVQQAGNNAFGSSNCTNNPQGTSYSPTWTLSGSFTVTNYVVTYWNGSNFVAASALTDCTGYEPQLWSVTIGSGSYSTTVSTVIYDPQPPSVAGGSTPYKLVFLQPVSQGTGTINAAVSPQPAVAVEDQKGAIVYGNASTVTLTASGGTGHLSSNCAGQINNGIVPFSNCSFSGTGTYSLTATEFNASLIPATGASYVITEAPPAKVVFTTSQLTQTASTNAGTTKVTVQEQDAFGNADPGAALTVNLASSSNTGFFTLTSGGVPASGVTSVTIPTGQSTVSFYYGDQTAGTPTFSAASPGLQTGTQTETINPAAENHLVFTTPPSTVGAGTSFTVGVTVEDQFGNTITTGYTGSNDSIKLALSSNGFAAGTTTLNASNGVATFTGLKIDVPGTNYTITATDQTHTAVTPVTSGTFTVTPPPPPSQLVFTSTVTSNYPVGTTANVGPFVVKVEDPFGNTVANTGAPVSLMLSSSSPGTYFFTPTSGGSSSTTVTIATGASSSSSFYYADTGAGTPTITASATVNTYIVSGTTNGFTMTPGAEKKLAITTQPPSSVGAGTSFTVGVTVEDQYGNTITTGTGSTDHVSVSLSPGNFATGTTTTAIATKGVATFTGLKINTLGSSYTITATDTTDTALAAVQTNSFAVTAGAPSKVVFTSTVLGNQGVSSTATVGPFAVQVEDQFGNPVTNSGHAVTLLLSSTSSGTTFFTPNSGGSSGAAVTIANGASTSGNFYYSDTSAGAPTINASATVNGSAASGSTNGFTMVAGAATQLNFTSTPTGNQTVSSTATVGPFAVQVEDQFGNAVTNTGTAVTLTLSTSSTGTTNPTHTPFFTPTHNGTTAATVSIANGTSISTNFYYSDTLAGSPNITVAGATVNSQAVTGDTTSGFTMVGGTANKLAFTTTVSGNQAVSPTATVGPFAVQVQDQYGNPVTNTGTAVTLTLTSTSTGTTFFTTTSGGTTAGTVTIPANNSTSSNFYYADNKLGSPTITASARVNGQNVTGNTTGFTMTAGAASKLAFTTTVTGNQAVGTTASVGAFAIQVQDQYGNPVTNTGTAVTLTLSSNSAGTYFFTPTHNATTATAVTIANGTSTSGNFYYSDTSAGARTINASATVNGSAASGSTNGFTMVAGVANKFAFTTTVTGNQTVSATATVGPFAVQVQDQYGNPVTNTGGAVTLALSSNSTGTTNPTHTPFFTTTSGGTTAGTVTIPANSSTSPSFYYSDTKPGTPTITLANATVNTQTVTGTTTNSFTMVAGAANKLVFTSTPTGNQTVSSTATVGPFALQVEDQYGNVVTNGATAATLTLTTTSTGTTNPTHTPFFTTTSGGTTAGTVTIPANSSTSSNFYYSDTSAGAPTINASATVNGSAASGSTNGFTMVAGAATQLNFTSTPTGNQTVSSTATVGPFAVQVEDQFGNAVTNTGTAVTLTLSTSSTGTTNPTHTPFFTPTHNGTTAATVSIANGTSISTNFYYSDTLAGSPNITVAGATVNSQAVTGDTTSGFTMVGGTANKLAFTTTVSGNQAVSPTATVGPFAVQVQDQYGNPVTNTGTAVTLTLTSTSTGTTFFTTTSGGTTAGTVTIPANNSTSSNFYYADNKLGSPTITASARVNGQNVTGNTTGFTMTAGAASKLAFTTTVTGNQAVGTTASVGAFAIQVQDQYGNPVTNTGTAVTLTLSSNSAGTYFFTPTHNATTATAVTIANGTSTSGNFYYSDTSAGARTINASATVNGSAASGSTNGFTMVAGVANKFAFTTTVTGNQTVSATATVGPFAVQVQDQYGNPVTNTGGAVTLALSSNSTGTTNPTHTPFFTTTSGGTTAGTVTIPANSSTSPSFYYSDTKPGTPTITLANATVNTQTVTGTTTNSFTMVAGAANKLVFTSTPTGNQTVSSTATVGPFALQVEDQYGNVVTNGATAATLTLTTTSTGTTNPTHTPFFTTTSGGTTAGTVTIPANSSTSSNFYYSDTSAGAPTINASATVNGSAASGSTNGFTMVAGAATQLNFTSTPTGNQTVSSTATVGPFAVQVEDQFGNAVTNTGTAVTLTLSTSSTGTTNPTHTPFFTPTHNGTTAATVSIANGTSISTNFYYSDTLAGSPNITVAGATVNSQAVTGDTTSGFTMVAGGVNSLSLSAASTTPAAGVADSLTITALDAYGNTATSYTASHNLTFGGANTIGTFAPTVTNSTPAAVNFASPTAITFANGVATTTTTGAAGQAVMKLYQAGTDVITVTDGTNTNGAGYSVTVSGGAANKFAFSTTVTGNQTVSSTATVGPFVAQVQDQYGNPVTNTGTAVTLTLSTNSTGTTNPTHTPFFTTTSGGTAATAVTIANGASTSGNFYYSDTKPGTPTITLGGATVNTQTVTGTTTNGFTMVPAAPNKLVYNPEPPATGIGNTTLTSFGVSVEDTYGNIETTGNTGATDTITLSLASTPTGGAFSSATGTYTNVAASNGTARFSSVALNNKAASYTFTASDTQAGDTGVTTATSTPATVITAGHIALVGTPSSATIKNATTLTLPAPSNLTVGDVLVAQVTARVKGASGLAAPTGWADVANASYENTPTIFQYIYTCAVTASGGCATPSSTSWTWNWTCPAGTCGGTGVADGSGGVSEFSGVSTTNPVDISKDAEGNGTATATVTSMNTNLANDEIVAFFASGGTANFSGQAPAGTNVPSSPNYAVTSANTGSCAGTTGACSSVAAAVVSTAVQSGVGATGAYSLPDTSTNYAWVASLVALEAGS